MIKKDLTNQEFGRLKVIEEAGRDSRGGIKWLCECSCGKKIIVRSNSLNQNNTKSCGCLKQENLTNRLEDLTGKKFSKLTVVKRSNTIRKTKKLINYWECVCDCGNIKIVSSKSLKGNSIRSCGCLYKDWVKSRIKADTPFRKLYYQYVRGSQEKNRAFNLSLDDFAEITKQNCYYCGIEPNQIIQTKGNPNFYQYNGIDRINNKKGYTKNNCVACCKYCNYSKRSSTFKEFKSWITKVYFNLNKKGNNEKFS